MKGPLTYNLAYIGGYTGSGEYERKDFKLLRDTFQFKADELMLLLLITKVAIVGDDLTLIIGPKLDSSGKCYDFKFAGYLVKDKDGIEIKTFVLFDEFRNCGNGKMLVKQLCSNSGLLWSLSQSIGFWEKMGFIKTKRLRKSGPDNLCLMLRPK
jgi:hypothetical protein